MTVKNVRARNRLAARRKAKTKNTVVSRVQGPIGKPGKKGMKKFKVTTRKKKKRK